MLLNKKLDEVAYEYISQLKKNGISSDYVIENVYRLHIQANYGNRKIRSIKLKDMRELQNYMFTKRHDEKSYSNKKIDIVKYRLNMILNFVVNSNILR